MLSGPRVLALAFRTPDLGLTCPAAENRESASFRWMSAHPETVLLRTAQFLPVHVLRPDGALTQDKNDPTSAPIRRRPHDTGERRVTT